MRGSSNARKDREIRGARRASRHSNAASESCPTKGAQRRTSGPKLTGVALLPRRVRPPVRDGLLALPRERCAPMGAFFARHGGMEGAVAPDWYELDREAAALETLELAV